MSNSSTLELTQSLIRRRSITPADDGCQALLCARLEALGFEIFDLPFGEVSNFWARYGSAGPVLCFAGHTDVVPPGQLTEWNTEPFEPTADGARLFGRGVADMKSSLAAMITATEDFLASHPSPSGSIAFLITSDEEGPAADGTRKVMEWLANRGESIDWCVVGEPSSGKELGDTIRVGRRGSLSGIMTIKGVQGHVAYPQEASNPIHAFARFVDYMNQNPLDEGNSHFPPTSFQVVRVDSDAGAPNVTPGDLRARFNCRYSTQWNHKQLSTHIEGVLESLGVNAEIQWRLSGEPFYTEPGTLTATVSEAVKSVTGLDPEHSTSGGTSDGRFIAPYGVDVVEIGPVNKTIHKVNEEIQIVDIDRLAAIYREILGRLLA